MKIVKMHLPHGRATNNPNKIILHSGSEVIDDQGQYHFFVDYLDMLGISAHMIILPSGLAIRCRADSEGAYHAKNNNKDSLGIEFMLPGCHSYFEFLKAIKKPYLTLPQAHTGYNIIQEWCRRYNITSDRIYTHSEVDPQRKQDPGFTFKELREIVRETKKDSEE